MAEKGTKMANPHILNALQEAQEALEALIKNEATLEKLDAAGQAMAVAIAKGH